MKQCLVILCLLSLVTANAQMHYLDRYEPVVIFPLNQSVDAENLSDSKGVFKASIHNKEKGGLPKLVPGARPFLGKAWDFKGVDSCFVSPNGEGIFTLGDIKNTKGISLSFWMKSDWQGKYTNHRIIGLPGVDISIGKGRGTGQVGAHFGEYHTSVGGDKNNDVFDDKWHHIVFTVDFTGKENNVIGYVDGKEVSRTSGFANKSFNSTNPSHLIVLGARGNRSYYFNGSLDDVAFFNFPLTPEQIAGIYAGPVFQGLDQEIYLPNKAELKGIAPADAKVKWSVKTGPGKANIQPADQPEAKAEFSAPGDYVLQFAVQGFPPKELNIKVNPASPPKVIAGDPVQLIPPTDTAELNGKISIPGLKKLDSVNCSWQKLRGPGEVTFSNPNSAKTNAKFSEPGVYQLQLTAEYNGLKGQDEVSVFYGKTTPRHYAELLNPLYLIPLDQPANRESAGIKELTGGTCAQLQNPGDSLPQIIPGAKPFTGNAWDFSKSSASVKVHNRYNIAELGNLDKTTGMSFSFWIKGPDYVRNYGRIGGGCWGRLISVEPMHLSKDQAGISANIGPVQGISSLKTGEQRNLFDGKWHHVVLVSDFKKDQDNVKLYVDGSQVYQASHKFTENFHDNRTDHTHFWGARPNGGGHPFKGHIDDIIAFSYPLSKEQVAYLFNGPNSEQQALLQENAPEVNAGPDQLKELPTQKVKLTGKVKGNNDLKYKWQLVKGPGPVTFSNPDKPETEVTFGPIGHDINNPDYREYVFRLTAGKPQGIAKLNFSDDVAVVFYKNKVPKTRQLSKTPPPGIHPRILFAPEDLPAMRERVKTDPYAVKAAELMRERYKKDLYNPNSPSGFIYRQLQEGNPDVDVKLQVGDGVGDVYGYTYGTGLFYGKMCGAAFLALMDDDQAKAKELATVLANCAKAQLKYYQPNYGSYLTHDASGALGLAYDFLYNYMTDEQRKPVRKLLSKMTKWRQSKGTGMISPDNSTNWRTFHDHIVIASLAIEGEEGYDPEVYRQNVHKLRDFLTQHGIFRSGYAHEGWGYFNFGMTSASLSALATTRREENLYETTNLYNSLLAHYRSMAPGQNWVFGHGDMIAGKLESPGNILWVGRYLWPEDPAISFLGNSLADSIMAAKDQRPLHLMPIMFAVGPNSQKQSMKSASEKLKLPLTLFCPDKGYVNTRSDWTDDALLLSFRCRMDKYFLGHMHPDVNSFEFFAKGHEWFTDPGKYSGPNDFHQTVLIDNVGGGGSSGAWTWPSLPGRFLEFQENELVTYGSGDAKAFYDYVYNKPDSGSQVKKHQFPEIKDHGLIWADFVYGKTRKDPMPAWRMEAVGGTRPLIQYNPVKQAFRTAALIRGKYPFVLIIDDYQKDDKKHDYQWVANCRAGTVEKVSGNKTDLVLKPKMEKDDGARLLVKVLQADGQPGEPEFESKTYSSGGKSEKAGTRVLINANSTVNPNFKVLLYPFKQGDPMPKITGKGDNITVTIGDQTRNIAMSKGADGRTKINITK